MVHVLGFAYQGLRRSVLAFEVVKPPASVRFMIGCRDNHPCRSWRPKRCDTISEVGYRCQNRSPVIYTHILQFRQVQDEQILYRGVVSFVSFHEVPRENQGNQLSHTDHKGRAPRTENMMGLPPTARCVFMLLPTAPPSGRRQH